MKTYTNKTQPTTISPEKYLRESYKGNEKVQKEALALVDVYTKASGSPCVMWNKIFGFGKYHYKDSKGGEHSHLITGFAISKTGFTLYNLIGWQNDKQKLVKLGNYKISGKSCLAIKSIKDIDLNFLQVVVKDSLAEMKKRYRTEK